MWFVHKRSTIYLLSWNMKHGNYRAVAKSSFVWTSWDGQARPETVRGGGYRSRRLTIAAKKSKITKIRPKTDLLIDNVNGFIFGITKRNVSILFVNKPNDNDVRCKCVRSFHSPSHSFSPSREWAGSMLFRKSNCKCSQMLATPQRNRKNRRWNFVYFPTENDLECGR